MIQGQIAPFPPATLAQDQGTGPPATLFYTQKGPDEHIDTNSVDDVTVEDNVFFNDFTPHLF